MRPEEECVIRLPNREWARVGAAELEALGYRVRVSDEPGPDGQWAMIVRGTLAQIEALRGDPPDRAGPADATSEQRPAEEKPALRCPDFDWQAFVNGALGGPEVRP
jgi:hypothetical protein